MPPHGPAVELEVLHGEPARRAAPLGHAPVHRHLGRAASKSASRRRKARRRCTTTTSPPSPRASSSGTACRRSTSRAATASSRPTWACGRRTRTRSNTRRCCDQAYGEAKTEEYLSRSIHHVLVYPYLSVQSPLQQLRCLRPISPDKTLSEIWHFRLKGAPEAIYRRSLWYFNLVNSPATMINADDLENWTKAQWGLDLERRRLGQLSPQPRRRPRRERRLLLEPRHLRGGDAQPVPGLDASTCRARRERA